MTFSIRSMAALAIMAGVAVPCSASASSASAKQPQPWRAVKCARYSSAWAGVIARRGTQGLGQEFLVRHAAFLASGCTARADVCPRSAEELRLANDMVILAMDAGTASTFPPFACRR